MAKRSSYGNSKRKIGRRASKVPKKMEYLPMPDYPKLKRKVKPIKMRIKKIRPIG